jgi:hypothetical protein
MENVSIKQMDEFTRTVAWAKQVLAHDEFTVWNGKPPFRYFDITHKVFLPKYF